MTREREESAAEEAAEFFTNLLADTLARDQRNAAIKAAYEADPAHARTMARVVYRCRRVGNRGGCMLLMVWQSPFGLAFYSRRYKLPHNVNLAQSSAAGREANTEDGVNHWSAIGGRLDDLRGFNKADLHTNCDHVRNVVPIGALFRKADHANTGHPKRVMVDR